MTVPDQRQAGPFADVVLNSEMIEAGVVIALIDGVINLITKAAVSIESGDRIRAFALIDRAEARLPDDDTVAESHRGGVVEARNALARLRERAAALEPST